MATFSYGPYYQSGIQAKEKQRKALTGRGYTPEELAGLNYGELMARYQEQEARRTREESKALQERGLSLQEQQFGAQKEQYASTLGLQEKQVGAQERYLASQARTARKTQESAEKAATISGVATGVNVLDKLGVLKYGGKAITGLFSPAKEVATYGVSELPEAAGWGEEAVGWAEEGESFFESASTIVSDAAASGTVICTELYDQGLLDSKIYMADSAFGALLPEDVLIGYKIWAVKIVKLMRRSPVFTKIVALFAIPWADEMAFKMGVKEKGNILGRTMLFIGIPICRMIGRVLIMRGGRLECLF